MPSFPNKGGVVGQWKTLACWRDAMLISLAKTWQWFAEFGLTESSWQVIPVLLNISANLESSPLEGQIMFYDIQFHDWLSRQFHSLGWISEFNDYSQNQCLSIHLFLPSFIHSFIRLLVYSSLENYMIDLTWMWVEWYARGANKIFKTKLANSLLNILICSIKT